MTGWRLPLRLARREVRRRPGRTALVALLVALPVAAMVIAVVLTRTDRAETRLEAWERDNGQADAISFFQPPSDDDTESAPQPHVELPEGTRSVPVTRDYQRVRTVEGHRADLDVRDLPLDDPITEGIHDLIAGRAASEPGEIVLGAQLAGRLGVDVGDDLLLDRPAARFEVVGLVEPTGCLSCPAALVAPGTMADAFDQDRQLDTVQLLDLPDGMTAAELTALSSAAEGLLTTRYRALQPEAGWYHGSSVDPIRWSFVLGAVALVVAGIVISAAFAVGARRQLVTLGQLSASGASPATVRATLVLQGSVTGLVGVAAGLAIAAAALLAGQDLIERILDERLDGYVARPSDLAGAAAIGVVAATVAALIPARSAARIPTLAALAGRRPVASVPRSLVVWGLVAFAGGLGLLGMASVGAQSGRSGQLWAYVAILGGVAELLGACAVAPVVVARLEPLARRLHGSWRLGARSLARHRARTGAVVSAVAAAGALAIAAGGLLLSNEAKNGLEVDVPDDVVVVREVAVDDERGVYEVSRPASDGIRTEVLSVLPGAEEVVVRATTFDPRAERAVIADESTLELLRASSETRDALAEIGVVVRDDGGMEERGPQMVLPDGRTAEAVGIPRRHTIGYFDRVLISPERARSLGLDVEPVASVFRADHRLTDDERDALDDLQFDLQSADDGYTEIRWSSLPTGPTTLQLELLLTGLALVFSLFVVGVSLALAAAESKDERDILTIAGAPPGTLARSAGARAWLLAAIGAVMAIPVGFLPVVVFVRTQGSSSSRFDDLPLVFPTRTALVLLIVVPLVVALVAWASSATAQHLRPVRVSTATFE